MADSYYFFALFLRLPFPPRLRVFSLIWSLPNAGLHHLGACLTPVTSFPLK